MSVNALPRLLWTAKEVAHVLGVSVDTVENLHRTRRLRAVRVGKHNRWVPADVAAFVERVRGEQCTK